MMKLRPVVVDDTGRALGGNVRYHAMISLGMEEIPEGWVVPADALTEEQKQEFIIKDNSNYGENDWGALANEWSQLPLADWGVKIPEDWLGAVNGIDAPELKSGDREPFIQMTFTLHDTQAVELNAAIFKAKAEGGAQSGVNENSNGNALAFIAEKFNRG